MEKETIKDKQTQYEAGAVLIREPIKFKIPFYFGTKLTLSIRPLTPNTITRVSMQESKLVEVSVSDNMIKELMKAGKNTKIFCRMIAYSHLDGTIKTKLFGKILTFFIGEFVQSNEHLFNYMMIVYKQMNAEHFFFIMQLTKGMNFLKKRTPTESNAGDVHSLEH